jgi:hypothetical protein
MVYITKKSLKTFNKLKNAKNMSNNIKYHKVEKHKITQKHIIQVSANKSSLLLKIQTF